VHEVRLTNEADLNRVVEVRFRIEHRYLRQIPVDSVATVSSVDIQGDKSLDLTRGHRTATLKFGDEVRFQPTPDVLKTLDLAGFEVRLRAIDALLADIQQGKGSLGEMFRKDDLYLSLVDKIAGLQKTFRAATSTQQTLGQLLYRDTLYQEILAPVQELDQALAKIERGEGNAGRLIATSTQYDRLRQSAGELRRQLAAINAGQGPAGRFLRRDDMWLEWNRRLGATIASVDSIVAGEGTAGRLLMDTHPYESLDGFLRQMRSSLYDFRSNPKKYLRLVLF
jgi:phospholipid/cholesterol/gamma-HCH transport system substrate-binding protein